MKYTVSIDGKELYKDWLYGWCVTDIKSELKDMSVGQTTTLTITRTE